MLEISGRLKPFGDDHGTASSRHPHEEIEEDPSDDHEDHQQNQGLNKRRSEIECKNVRTRKYIIIV